MEGPITSWPTMIMGPSENGITATHHQARVMDFSWKFGRHKVSSRSFLFIIISSCEWYYC